MANRSRLPTLLVVAVLLSGCTGRPAAPAQSAAPTRPPSQSTAATSPNPAQPPTELAPQPATLQVPPDYLPAPQLSRFFALPGSDRIWTVGRDCNTDGTCQSFIQASADQGRTWQVEYRGQAELDHIQFADAQNGWAWGPAPFPQFGKPAPSGVLIRTENGGRTWQQVDTLTPPANALVFTGAQTGWAGTGACTGPAGHAGGVAGAGVACNGELLYTADGGATWTARLQPGLPVLAVQFLGQQGWAVLSGQDGSKPAMRILHTGDGGATWSVAGAVPASGSEYAEQADLQFADSTHGWLTLFSMGSCAMHGCSLANTYHTTDGGQTWELVKLPPHSEVDEPCGPIVAPVLSVAGTRAAAVIRGTSLSTCRPPAGQLFLSTDGGTSWQLGHAWPGGRPRQISWKAGGATWALTGQALTYSADGGSTWVQRWPALHPTRAIHFINDEDGWGLGLAGDSGAVLKTTDGGETWDVAGSIPDVTLQSGSFLPDGTGWVTAQTGLNQWALYRTADGGVTWTPVWRPPDQVITLRFNSPAAGILATTKSVWLTRDGGRIWSIAADLPVDADHPAAYFADLKEGWVTGGLKGEKQEALLHTKDGGLTWETVTTLPASSSSMPVQFDGENGWVGVPAQYTGPDENGRMQTVPARLLITADGGRTWQTRTLGFASFGSGQLPGSPLAVDLLKMDQGWLITSTGELWRTRDHGATWVPAPNPAPGPANETSTLTLGGALWQISVPAGLQPMTAAGEEGILWISFPPTTGVNPGDAVSLQRPQGDYTVMYTPLRSEGGDLADGARRIITLSGAEKSDYRHIRQVEAVSGDKFLLFTWVIYPGAQTGGTAEVRWIDPISGTSKLLLSSASGGGSNLTITHNDRWLFWNQSVANVPTFDPLVKNARAYLADLTTGETGEIQLGGDNWALKPTWSTDGKLHFQLEGDSGTRVLDPSTRAVSP